MGATQTAERGRDYPAWRDGRKISSSGPRLHAVTDRPAGHTYRSGFLALCGMSVRYKVEDVFDVDDPQSCLLCAAAIIGANA